LERMIAFVLLRYEYSKEQFAAGDRRRGLIYGSPEADLGDPNNDFPKSHPLYYQNSVWIWRGLSEHSRCLRLAAQLTHDDTLNTAAAGYEAIANEMRANIQASLEATLALRSADMKAAGITPFTPTISITHRNNYRVMRTIDLCRTGSWPTGAMRRSISAT